MSINLIKDVTKYTMIQNWLHCVNWLYLVNSLYKTEGNVCDHYCDVIMSAMASLITSLTILYSAIYSGADKRKHQSSASLVFVWGIPRWLGNSAHKGPVTWKIFPFDDVIMDAHESVAHDKDVVLPQYFRLSISRRGIKFHGFEFNM